MCIDFPHTPQPKSTGVVSDRTASSGHIQRNIDPFCAALVGTWLVFILWWEPRLGLAEVHWESSKVSSIFLLHMQKSVSGLLKTTWNNLNVKTTWTLVSCSVQWVSDKEKGLKEAALSTLTYEDQSVYKPKKILQKMETVQDTDSTVWALHGVHASVHIGLDHRDWIW